MTDQIQNLPQENVPQVPQVPQPQPEQKGILGMTLGQLLQNNTHAQDMIMKTMQINPQQFQQMLQSTGNNQLMNQSIGDLFKNGIVQQAMTMHAVKLTPEQSQQIAQAMQQTGQQQGVPQGQMAPVSTEDKVPYVFPQEPQKPSLMQKVLGWFK